MTPKDLAEHLRRIDIDAILGDALARASGALAESIRTALSQPPGSAAHDTPWRETGDLQSSIGAESDATGAVIGSTSNVALYQEHGTATVPPRPFLAPIAADASPAIAEAIGGAVAHALAPAN